MSSRKICNSGDLEATVLISYLKQGRTYSSCTAVALYLKREFQNATLEPKCT